MLQKLIVVLRGINVNDFVRVNSCVQSINECHAALVTHDDLAIGVLNIAF